MKPDAYKVVQAWLATRAKKTLQVGQRVIVSTLTSSPGRPGPLFGTVAPPTKAYPDSISVLRDGAKKPVPFHPSYWKPIDTQKGDTGFREAYLWCRLCKAIVVQYTHGVLSDRELAYLCQKGHTNRVPSTIGENR